ncbi:hypothetical protein [Nodosilinea sp. E11]|uniref:hypothetical protein n=1 Tax=Nodosilinea sp. E11 TaxID=3037479 RepID=UPI0029349622|nr:hypothetical protein [Nodosilinea sp. E11]WOD40348.1 hypothetical protein RRF56_06020 [Nodosilinea sp. E11]
MIDKNRIQVIEEHLALLREQLYGLEQAKILASADEKVRLEQRIRIQCKPEIRKYEIEYWETLANQSRFLQIPETEADIAVKEITQQVSLIENSNDILPGEKLADAIGILVEIRDKLNHSNDSAALKLKGVISSFPPFVGIACEAELDTEKFLVKYFPTFIGCIEKAKKKLLPQQI